MAEVKMQTDSQQTDVSNALNVSLLAESVDGPHILVNNAGVQIEKTVNAESEKVVNQNPTEN